MPGVRPAAWLTSALLLAILGCGGAEKQAPGGQQDGGRRILYYRSPMDPTFISRHPGKDSMGMKLVPVREGDPGAELSAVLASGALVQRMGVRLAPVTRAPLERLVRAVGLVQVDERRLATINMKFDAWIEKLWVDETGQHVERGAPLFAVYSPELVASAREYVDVLKAAGPRAALARAARQRLRQFDVPQSYLDHVARTRQAPRQIVIPSPVGGYVIQKNAYEGTFVRKGANLFTIGDLSALWVIADVYELDAPWVAVGQRATIELDYLPGRPQEARVDYVYPVLDQRSRTVQVRLVLPNPEVALKPGMFATVRIHTRPVGNVLVVPAEAVIHSGERNVVFVAQGGGRFVARDLRLGVRGEQGYRVLAGLTEGEQVVVSGQFLFDSEANLKEAVLKLLGTNVKPGDGGMPMPMDAGGGMRMGDGGEH